LLQPELKAIKDGLIYVKEKHEKNDEKYRGYLNAQGLKQGLGVLENAYGNIDIIGEWHEDKLHGIAK
jgi:hypothetical protein